MGQGECRKALKMVLVIVQWQAFNINAYQLTNGYSDFLAHDNVCVQMCMFYKMLTRLQSYVSYLHTKRCCPSAGSVSF